MPADPPAVDTSAEAVKKMATWLMNHHAADDAAAMLRALLAERDAARRVIEAARAYYYGYCQDEAENHNFCVDYAQHFAAQELRDALAALNPPPRGEEEKP